MLMDVTKIAQKLKQKAINQELESKNTKKHLKDVTKQLKNNIKKINVENNQQLDDYLNNKLKESIKNNIYTFSLDHHDFTKLYSLLELKKTLTESLLEDYNKLHGSQYTLNNYLNKELFKKINRYVNQQKHLASNFLEVSPQQYELMIYISL